MRAARLASVCGLLLLAAGGAPAAAADPGPPRFKAVVFDLLVLFDPNSVAAAVEKEFPGKGAAVAAAWRSKQFEYCFLRSIASRHEDFFQVTGDALDYTARAMRLELTPARRKRLLDAYLRMTPWPDAVESLKKLRAAGVRVAVLSNFSGRMLLENVRNAGIEGLIDVPISTEINGTYKPDPRAYALGTGRLQLEKSEVLFVAFGGWDAFGARAFGYTTYWVDRSGLPPESLGVEADASAPNLSGLLGFALRR